MSWSCSPDSGGISGGERRRVTIGIELVTGSVFSSLHCTESDIFSASLLLLDEPDFWYSSRFSIELVLFIFPTFLSVTVRSGQQQCASS